MSRRPVGSATVRVSIGDCRLYVDVEGLGLVPDGATMRQRPTLLALHGGPGFDHTSFKPDFGTLADVAQIVYVDHRGQGRSDHCTPDTWHFAQWADDIVALCEALEIERPFVYGVSFGSMVAAHYGVRHPGHAAGLILDSTAAHADLPAIVAMFQRLGGDEAAQAATGLLGGARRGDDGALLPGLHALVQPPGSPRRRGRHGPIARARHVRRVHALGVRRAAHVRSAARAPRRSPARRSSWPGPTTRSPRHRAPGSSSRHSVPTWAASRCSTTAATASGATSRRRVRRDPPIPHPLSIRRRSRRPSGADPRLGGVGNADRLPTAPADDCSNSSRWSSEVGIWLVREQACRHRGADDR